MLVGEALGRTLADAKERGSRSGNHLRGPRGTGELLGELAKIYHAAGRPADVVRLLDEAAVWGVGDVAQLNSAYGHYGMHGDRSGEPTHAPVAFDAAWDLAATGHTNEASRILDALLGRSPGLDRLYELLIQLEPDDPVPHLDRLFARDPFKERPLIWKIWTLPGVTWGIVCKKSRIWRGSGPWLPPFRRPRRRRPHSIHWRQAR